MQINAASNLKWLIWKDVARFFHSTCIDFRPDALDWMEYITSGVVHLFRVWVRWIDVFIMTVFILIY